MAKTKATAATTTIIEIPVGEQGGGYVQRHLQAKLTHDQAVALRRLMAGLDGRKMANGRYVQSSADAIRWLLEQIPD